MRKKDETKEIDRDEMRENRERESDKKWEREISAIHRRFLLQHSIISLFHYPSLVLRFLYRYISGYNSSTDTFCVPSPSITTFPPPYFHHYVSSTNTLHPQPHFLHHHTSTTTTLLPTLHFLHPHPSSTTTLPPSRHSFSRYISCCSSACLPPFSFLIPSTMPPPVCPPLVD